ncbi:unnamed protein product [Citrullus colocynthis]|uniref:Uncharacterized protein n=1 Tax=Citrullus colocynthis TaxID=252529 RepID=A0ABP0YHB8_9ROSI
MPIRTHLHLAEKKGNKKKRKRRPFTIIDFPHFSCLPPFYSLAPPPPPSSELSLSTVFSGHIVALIFQNPTSTFQSSNPQNIHFCS